MDCGAVVMLVAWSEELTPTLEKEMAGRRARGVVQKRDAVQREAYVQCCVVGVMQDSLAG